MTFEIIKLLSPVISGVSGIAGKAVGNYLDNKKTISANAKTKTIEYLHLNQTNDSPYDISPNTNSIDEFNDKLTGGPALLLYSKSYKLIENSLEDATSTIKLTSVGSYANTGKFKHLSPIDQINTNEVHDPNVWTPIGMQINGNVQFSYIKENHTFEDSDDESKIEYINKFIDINTPLTLVCNPRCKNPQDINFLNLFRVTTDTYCSSAKTNDKSMRLVFTSKPIFKMIHEFQKLENQRNSSKRAISVNSLNDFVDLDRSSPVLGGIINLEELQDATLPSKRRLSYKRANSSSSSMTSSMTSSIASSIYDTRKSLRLYDLPTSLIECYDFKSDKLKVIKVYSGKQTGEKTDKFKGYQGEVILYFTEEPQIALRKFENIWLSYKENELGIKELAKEKKKERKTKGKTKRRKRRKRKKIIENF